MNLFDRFETKEKILTALEECIQQDINGNYFLSNPDDKGKTSEFTQLHQEYQKLLEENEKLKKETASGHAAIEELASLNPSELQKKMKNYTKEKSELLANNEHLTNELKKLNDELEYYHQKEREDQIRTILHEEAEKLGIRPEAIRDVDRLIYWVYENEDGSLTTEDGLTISELLKNELALSPHWLPDSLAGGSHSIQPFLSSMPQNIQFENAKKNQDITGMILNAPIID